MLTTSHQSATLPTATSEIARIKGAAAVGLGMNRHQAIATVILLILIVAMPQFVYPTFLMKIMCYALFACAFNLVLGYAGLLPFGHAAFFGTGAYLAACGAKMLELPPELAMFLGASAAAVLGLAFGYLAIKRQGLYFAMITLALAQMTYFFYLQAPFTNGEDGLQGVPRGSLLGLVPLENDGRMYWFVAAVFLAGFLIIARTVHSPFGQVLRGIRENEPRTISLGYPTNRYKLMAFALSAGLAGAAGATKTLVFGIATLSDVSLEMSSLVLLMALLGGLGTLVGPIVGAVIVASVEVKLTAIGSWVTIVQGLIFIGCVLVFKRGVIGEVNRLFGTRL